MKLNINNIDMTFEEAKKILEKEGFYVEKDTRRGTFNESFAKYEDSTICEAMQVVCSAGYKILMFKHAFEARKARLKKEYEKNTKAPGPGEEQPKENSLKAATDAFILQANEIMRLKKKNAELLEAIDKMKNGNPALKESASQFNDALLDEQAKKIAELTKEKSSLKAQITVLNACKKHNDKIDRKQIKCLGKEIARLNGIIHDKNAILSDVAEELRLTKSREKNLAELGLKYVVENEKLKEQLADKVVDKIDAQALKSAESALAWKEKVIARKDMALAYYKKKIAEKDEVIADLTHELKAKHKKYVWYKGAYDAAQQILNTIADYAAKHPDKKFSDQMVGIDNAEEGGDQSATIVQCGNGITISKEEAEIIERCTKNSTELHYSKKDGFTYTNVFGEEMPIRCLRGMFYAFTDEEIENMKK